MQYLFLNGRAIRDRALQHALGEAYRGLMLTGRQPICFLRLDMPAELVDVNVHPTKQEVRFQDSGRLYSQLLGTLRTKFLTTDLTARGARPAADVASGEAEVESATSGASELVQWAKQELGKQVERAGASSPPRQQSTRGRGRPGSPVRVCRTQPLRLHRLDVRPRRSNTATASRRSDRASRCSRAARR